MKIYLVLFFLTFNCFYSQSRKDSLYTFFKTNSDVRTKKLYKADSTKYRVYRFDSNWVKEFNEYKNLVSKSDIDHLKKSDNASLHLIGILIDLNNNNSKENFFEEMNELANNDKFEFVELFINGKDKGSLFLEGGILKFIKLENDFYKPSFQLTRREYVDLNIKFNRIKIVPYNKLKREYYKSNH